MFLYLIHTLSLTIKTSFLFWSKSFYIPFPASFNRYPTPLQWRLASKNHLSTTRTHQLVSNWHPHDRQVHLESLQFQLHPTNCVQYPRISTMANDTKYLAYPSLISVRLFIGWHGAKVSQSVPTQQSRDDVRKQNFFLQDMSLKYLRACSRHHQGLLWQRPFLYWNGILPGMDPRQRVLWLLIRRAEKRKEIKETSLQKLRAT